MNDNELLRRSGRAALSEHRVEPALGRPEAFRLERPV